MNEIIRIEQLLVVQCKYCASKATNAVVRDGVLIAFYCPSHLQEFKLMQGIQETTE